jgi:CheY-like chemotaxis protein
MQNDKIIMIIDDDPDDKDLFVEIVNEIDPEYSCVWGTDGLDGIRKLTQLPTLPKYIFLDLNMPRMNGKQCLVEIKRDQKFKHIPVIIFSTSKLESDIIESKKLGASFYMTKPSLFHELRDAVSHLLLTENSTKSELLRRL